MENKQAIENFKNAVFSTAKAIARNTITADEQKKIAKITIPKIHSINSTDEILEARAIADSEALRIRYNDDSISKKNEPRGKVSKSLYKIAEKIRYEKIGSDEYLGIQKNLNNFYKKRILHSEVHSQNFIADAFEAYLRKNMMNLVIDESKKQDFKRWDDLFDKKILNKLKDLHTSINNQQAYTQLVNSIIEELEINDQKSEPENIENENSDENNPDNQNQQQSMEEENQQSKNQEFEMDNIVPEIEFDPSMNDQEAMLGRK